MVVLNRTDATTQITAQMNRSGISDNEKNAWRVVLDNVGAIYGATPAGAVEINANNQLVLDANAQTWLNRLGTSPEHRNIKTAFDTVTPHSMFGSNMGTLVGGGIAAFIGSSLLGLGPIGTFILGLIGAIGGAMFDGPNSFLGGMLGGQNIPGFRPRPTVAPGHGMAAAIHPVNTGVAPGNSPTMFGISRETSAPDSAMIVPTGIIALTDAQATALTRPPMAPIPAGNYTLVARGTITGQHQVREFNFTNADLVNTSGVSIGTFNVSQLSSWNRPVGVNAHDQLMLNPAQVADWREYFQKPANVEAILGTRVAPGAPAPAAGGPVPPAQAQAQAAANAPANPSLRDMERAAGEISNLGAGVLNTFSQQFTGTNIIAPAQTTGTAPTNASLGTFPSPTGPRPATQPGPNRPVTP